MLPSCSDLSPASASQRQCRMGPAQPLPGRSHQRLHALAATSQPWQGHLPPHTTSVSPYFLFRLSCDSQHLAGLAEMGEEGEIILLSRTTPEKGNFLTKESKSVPYAGVEVADPQSRSIYPMITVNHSSFCHQAVHSVFLSVPSHLRFSQEELNGLASGPTRQLSFGTGSQQVVYFNLFPFPSSY